MLIIGGVIIGIQLSQRGNTPTPSPTVTATQGSGTATSPTPNTGATVTSTPGQNATATPTAYTTPTAPTATTGPNQGPTPAITAGPLLYAASSPGPNCDHGNGKWAAFRGPGITCQNTQTTITSTATSPILEGMFLTGLPNQDTPSNYVIQAQLNAAPQSNGDFGIYFRNQPGSNQQGVYAFLIHADGTWSTNVYDNATGRAKRLPRGLSAMCIRLQPWT
ncbi:hypothetical protein EPA93_18830 [Ktedonosporobacter rubrisoli]|uniref:Uncharacterized protein n=1 Tax=Ktedonosporobacter rubrisoli TaxID=2509675 RepID=A0A4P6JR74_KTERU|nr:hypothetical protein [Ktedonosporobacter rubrisoli]QBD77938.1 hypothetical protein EPA93_18830 [Ktedonosporobacter rubrisoli]